MSDKGIYEHVEEEDTLSINHVKLLRECKVRWHIHPNRLCAPFHEMGAKKTVLDLIYKPTGLLVRRTNGQFYESRAHAYLIRKKLLGEALRYLAVALKADVTTKHNLSQKVMDGLSDYVRPIDPKDFVVDGVEMRDLPVSILKGYC